MKIRGVNIFCIMIVNNDQLCPVMANLLFLAPLRFAGMDNNREVNQVFTECAKLAKHIHYLTGHKKVSGINSQ